MGVVADFDLAVVAFNGADAYERMVERREDIRIDQLIAAAAGVMPARWRFTWPPAGYFAGDVWVDRPARPSRHQVADLQRR